MALEQNPVVTITQPPYNAPANGSDISAILNRAIADTSASGLTIYIPKGTYGIRQINLTNYTRIVGAGRQKTVLNHLGSGNGFTNPTSAEIGMIVFEDFTVNANANSKTLFDLPRVYMSTFNRVHMYCPSNSPNMIGMHFYDGSTKAAFYNSCYDVSINGFMGTGFKFSDNGNSNRLINCRTNLVKYPVVAENYTDHIVITGCAFEVFEVGVTLGGVFCQVTHNRFENVIGGKIGVRIISPYLNQNHTIMGNQLYYGLKYVVNDSPYEGNNFIHFHEQFQVKNFKHEPSGGWLSDQNLRNNGLLQVGFIDLQRRTTAPSVRAGRIVYADGTSWSPGQGEGFYGRTSTGWVKLG
jgi:hypothetical protein